MMLLNSKFKYETTYISTEPLDETSIKRRLAYPIKHQTEAYYTTKILDSIPEEVSNPSILRRLVVKINMADKAAEKIEEAKKPKLKIEELDKKLEEILEEEVTK